MVYIQLLAENMLDLYLNAVMELHLQVAYSNRNAL